ncbi:MAG: glycosyl hydrolase 115 family protein [Terracidiphilus sp.]
MNIQSTSRVCPFQFGLKRGLRLIGSCLTIGILLAAYPSRSFALGQPSYIQTLPLANGLRLAGAGGCAELYVDSGDFPGVARAVKDLSEDIARVSGCEAPILESRNSLSGEAVLIGTIGKSGVIDNLVRAHKIDIREIQGKWEATLIQVVDNPQPGVRRALVIAGSDKRGTIYGIYDLSEQIGVSPWYWWADVPVKHSDTLYVEPGRRVQGEPAVKYRGIFLNDEAPSLAGWAKEKFGGFNHLFYEKVFELLLRLKANYLWPAMWDSAFAADDPLNAKLADEYGIVMGTSHEEPMMCAEKEWKPADGPWNYVTNEKRIDDFWRGCMSRDQNYEEVVTLGMRGHNDTPMSTDDNIAQMEKIIADQRQILSETVNHDLDKIPQVWALYKEVQTYYEKGMRVPNDITLLWSDDNWGNLRRLPTPEERKRSGGAGIYYHFDYVGDPRSYKWLNTYPITKVWEQMNRAYAYGANRIWIVNVGDLKPMEFPIEFFLSFARDPSRWGKDNLTEFSELWAAREFGPEHAKEIADIVSRYTQYNGRRKPEQLEPNTYSLLNFAEADRVFSEWKALTERAETIYREISPEKRDAFFELVLYPTKASAIVNELYITAGKNRLYAAQGRASANDLAQQARDLFAADAALTDEYNHKLAHGKWDHMMDQTHIGYTFWNQPPVNAMPAVSEVQPAPEARMGIAVEGSALAVGEGSGSNALPEFDGLNPKPKFIDVFNRGEAPFKFSIIADQPWIKLSETEGTVAKDARVWVSIDWDAVHEARNDGIITITQTGLIPVRVHVEALKPSAPELGSFDGFVEADHYVSIEAGHFAGGSATDQAHWETIPGFGETLSGMTIFPVTAASAEPQHPAPTLEYRMYLWDSGTFNVQAILAPTLNFVPLHGLRYAVSFDDRPPQLVDALANDSHEKWEQAVSDGVRKITSTLNVDTPGYHTLKFKMVDPGVVLEKLVVSQGTVPTSYLGPPESYRSASVAH